MKNVLGSLLSRNYENSQSSSADFSVHNIRKRILSVSLINYTDVRYFNGKISLSPFDIKIVIPRNQINKGCASHYMQQFSSEKL